MNGAKSILGDTVRFTEREARSVLDAISIQLEIGSQLGLAKDSEAMETYRAAHEKIRAGLEGSQRVVCWCCGKPGHHVKRCPEYNKSPLTIQIVNE